LLKVKSLRIQQ